MQGKPQTQPPFAYPCQQTCGEVYCVSERAHAAWHTLTPPQPTPLTSVKDQGITHKDLYHLARVYRLTNKPRRRRISHTQGDFIYGVTGHKTRRDILLKGARQSDVAPGCSLALPTTMLPQQRTPTDVSLSQENKDSWITWPSTHLWPNTPEHHSTPKKQPTAAAPIAEHHTTPERSQPGPATHSHTKARRYHRKRLARPVTRAILDLAVKTTNVYVSNPQAVVDAMHRWVTKTVAKVISEAGGPKHKLTEQKLIEALGTM